MTLPLFLQRVRVDGQMTTVLFNLFFFFFTFIFSLPVYEKSTREQRMRTEISQAKREANFYVQNVEKGRAIEAKKRKGTYQV